jgi:hypothetical protein
MIARSSYRGIRTVFPGAWRKNSLRPWAPSVDTETVRPIFAGIWQESGRTHSVILAQATSLSLKQRRLFLLEVAKLVDPALGMEPKFAERDAAIRGEELRVPGGRIHIFLRSRDFILVGFEDEKAAAYQEKPLLRYDEYLRARNPHPLLAFFSRGLHMPTEEQAKKFRRFVPVDDGRFVGWADECLIDWLGNAERHLGNATERVDRCFADSPAASAPQITAFQGVAG